MRAWARQRRSKARGNSRPGSAGSTPDGNGRTCAPAWHQQALRRVFANSTDARRQIDSGALSERIELAVARRTSQVPTVQRCRRRGSRQTGADSTGGTSGGLAGPFVQRTSSKDEFNNPLGTQKFGHSRLVRTTQFLVFLARGGPRGAADEQAVPGALASSSRLYPSHYPRKANVQRHHSGAGRTPLRRARFKGGFGEQFGGPIKQIALGVD